MVFFSQGRGGGEAEIKHHLPTARQTAEKLADVIRKGDQLTPKGVLTFIQYIFKKRDFSLLAWFKKENPQGIKV